MSAMCILPLRYPVLKWVGVGGLSIGSIVSDAIVRCQLRSNAIGSWPLGCFAMIAEVDDN